MPPVVEVQYPNHWTAKEVHKASFKIRGKKKSIKITFYFKIGVPKIKCSTYQIQYITTPCYNLN